MPIFSVACIQLFLCFSAAYIQRYLHTALPICSAAYIQLWLYTALPKYSSACFEFCLHTALVVDSAACMQLYLFKALHMPALRPTLTHTPQPTPARMTAPDPAALQGSYPYTAAFEARDTIWLDGSHLVLRMGVLPSCPQNRAAAKL